MIEKKPTTLSLLDSAIWEANHSVKSQLPWIHKTFGKAQRLVRKVGREKFLYPAVLSDLSGDYIELLPNDSMGNFMFWDIQDPQKVDWYPDHVNSITTSFGIVLWFDMRNVFDSSEGRNIELIKDQFLRTLKTDRVLNSRIEILEIFEKPEYVYRGYTISEIKDQFAMHPYGCLRFQGNIKLRPKC